MLQADPMELQPEVDFAIAPAFAQRLASLQSNLPHHADKPDETGDATLRVLWHLAAGQALSVVSAASSALPVLDAAALRRLDALMSQRLSGQPLAHLSRRQHFMGLDMLVGPEALIPRVETEQLGRVALSLLQGVKQPSVLDLCTGCGNLALGVAHHAPQAKVWGGDLCDAAIALAQRNAQHLGLSQRVEFRSGDLFAPFQDLGLRGQLDLIVCNPPYISSGKIDSLPAEIHDHEPRMAFDGGPLGVNVLHRLLREAALFLRPGGWLALEVGRGQGQSVLKRLRAQAGTNGAGTCHFESPLSASDAVGDIRVVMTRRAAL
jgi:release factor glutamine methyltransferase